MRLNIKEKVKNVELIEPLSAVFARTDCNPTVGFTEFLADEAKIADDNYEYVEEAGFLEAVSRMGK